MKPREEMGNEGLLVLRCARKEPTGALAGTKLDWERLLRMAASHGLSSRLYGQLKAAGEGVPAAVLAELRQRAIWSAARGLKLTDELIRVMDGFRDDGIKALPFKGPALAERLYGDVTSREFSDLDILVHKQDLEHAMETLGRLGYGWAKAGRGLARFEAGYHMRVMVREKTGAVVDLHWGLVHERFVRDGVWAEIWDRLGRVRVGGREMPALADEDLLHYLCVHGSKHMWASLGWVCDIAELLRARPEIHWFVLMERARRGGTRRMLLSGLLLAHELLEAPAPAWVLEQARQDAAARRLAAEAAERMFDERLQRLGPFGGAWLRLRASERWSDRARHVLMIVGSPSCVWHGVRVLGARVRNGDGDKSATRGSRADEGVRPTLSG